MMLKWVKYNKETGKFSDCLDQKNLLSTAKILINELNVYGQNIAIKKVNELLREILDLALMGGIKSPVTLPNLRLFMELMDLPESTMNAINNFYFYATGTPHLRFKIGLAEYYANEIKYLKEVDGQWYILEEFE